MVISLSCSEQGCNEQVSLHRVGWMGRWPGECVAKEADSTRQGTGVQIQLRKGKAVASEGQGNQYSQGVGTRVSSCDDRK